VAAAGIALFAISYDSVAILRDFAAAHGITFPLLSDEGSHVMRGLGLINERVQEDHAAYGIPPNPRHVNLPYPGVFVLDAAGVVTRKVFHESYRERDSGGGLVAQAIGLFTTSPKAATAAGPVVTVRAWLDSPTYAWFQRLTLTVEVTVAPGHHVYGQPAAAGPVPTRRGDRAARRARGGLGHLAGTTSLGLAGARRRDVGPRRHRAGNAGAHVHRGPGWWQPRHRHPRGLSGV